MIQLRLLGSVDFTGSDGQTLRPVLAQPKRAALFAYLAIATPLGFHRRDKLLGLFWPESDAEHARGALRTALYFLRRSLGDGVVVSRGEEEVGLVPGAVLCDAVAFEEALERGELEKAVELYRGDLLDGFYVGGLPEFERWVELERQRLFDACAGALEKLAEEAEAAEDHRRAVAWWKRAILRDPYNSRYALRLMQAMAVAGDRGNALQFAQEHERRLSEELGTEPDPKLLALAERLRSGTGREAQPLGHVAPLAIDAERTASEGPPVPWLTRRKGLRIGTLTAAVAVAVVAGLTWYVGRGRVASETVPATAGSEVIERKAIAVLPFENLSGDPEDEYFTAGIHDEIITRLAGIGALKVISRGSVMEFKDPPANPRTVAERLGVDFVLEGGVRRSGDRVRITAQLIHARTDEHLWAETYDRTLRDIFDVQSDVANQVVRALQTTLTPVEQARIARSPTENVDAHKAYLRGRIHWNKRTPEGVRTAIEHFKRAIEEDPQYAVAYSGLADSYIILAAYEVVRPSAVIPAARAAALRALEIDSLLGEAHNSLAWIKLGYDWDFVGAGKGFERAIELNPSYATARLWYAVYARALGRLNESLTRWRKAQELDPLSVNITADLGFPLSDRGDHEAAVEQFRRALDLEPGFAAAHAWLGLTYAYQGRFEPAIRECEKAVELSERHPLWVGILAYVYAAADRPVAARSLLQELQERSEDEYIAAWLFAPVYAKLGEMDLAFQWLERATEERGSVTHHLKLDPRFAEMRADPRFSALLREIGIE
jgi:TolB-like protein/DNA-binding SARP family transcriptional activator